MDANIVNNSVRSRLQNPFKRKPLSEKLRMKLTGQDQSDIKINQLLRKESKSRKTEGQNSCAYTFPLSTLKLLISMDKYTSWHTKVNINIPDVKLTHLHLSISLSLSSSISHLLLFCRYPDWTTIQHPHKTCFWDQTQLNSANRTAHTLWICPLGTLGSA